MDCPIAATSRAQARDDCPLPSFSSSATAAAAAPSTACDGWSPGQPPQKVLLSWSGGKDCAFSLHLLQSSPQFEVVGLITTLNEDANRVAMHGIRRDVAQAVADGLHLPIWWVPLPSPCTNDVYEAAMRLVYARAASEHVTYIAYGDVHLADVRAYRELKLAGTGLSPLFPLWETEGGAAASPALARRIVSSGLRAIVTCVDPKQLDASFCGRQYDAAFLADLPPGVDHCGEGGEFHTLAVRVPIGVVGVNGKGELGRLDDGGAALCAAPAAAVAVTRKGLTLTPSPLVDGRRRDGHAHEYFHAAWTSGSLPLPFVEVPVSVGETVTRGGFVFTDVLLLQQQ